MGVCALVLPWKKKIPKFDACYRLSENCVTIMKNPYSLMVHCWIITRKSVYCNSNHINNYYFQTKDTFVTKCYFFIFSLLFYLNYAKIGLDVTITTCQMLLVSMKFITSLSCSKSQKVCFRHFWKCNILCNHFWTRPYNKLTNHGIIPFFLLICDHEVLRN